MNVDQLLINSQCLHFCAQTVFHLSHWLNAVDMNMKFNDKPHYYFNDFI